MATVTTHTTNNKSINGALPPGWRMVRFGEMADSITDRVDDPAEAGVEFYVGLEHLDPESLKIRRWGKPTEVEATKLRFKPGDIIFGRRRAYQRKLAVAEFEGICSAHALVLRAREDVVLPEFLPFFMQSDIFFERAMAISVGSLSPTINWKTLVQQEFALPPRDEQRRIAEILWAADAAVESYLIAHTFNREYLYTAIQYFMEFGVNQVETIIENGRRRPKHWKIRKLQEVAAVERGRFSHRPRNLPQFYGGPYPFVQTGDVAESNGTLNRYEQTLSEEGRAISRSFKAGSILITIAAIIGKTAVTTFETWCPDSVVGITPSKEIDVFFLEFYLRTVQQFLESQAATQTAQKNINLAILRPIPIPVPPLNEQQIISEQLLSLQKSIDILQEHIERLKALKQGVLDQALNLAVLQNR